MTKKASSWFASAVVVLAATVIPGVALADGIPCMPINVFENLINRTVMVECAAVQNGVKFIAISAAGGVEESARADRYISMALAAQLSGQKFFVWTNDSTSVNPTGCSTANCRRGDQWGLQK